MGKAFFLIAYGMAWGYVIHAKEIDKKVAAAVRDGWDEFIRHNIRVQQDELEAPRVVIDVRKTAVTGEKCCVCGDVNIGYRNYQGKPFCWPCADGRPAPDENLTTPEAQLHAAG